MKVLIFLGLVAACSAAPSFFFTQPLHYTAHTMPLPLHTTFYSGAFGPKAFYSGMPVPHTLISGDSVPHTFYSGKLEAKDLDDDVTVLGALYTSTSAGGSLVPFSYSPMKESSVVPETEDEDIDEDDVKMQAEDVAKSEDVSHEAPGTE